jgi:hypothetical protein
VERPRAETDGRRTAERDLDRVGAFDSAHGEFCVFEPEGRLRHASDVDTVRSTRELRRFIGPPDELALVVADDDRRVLWNSQRLRLETDRVVDRRRE